MHAKNTKGKEQYSDINFNGKINTRRRFFFLIKLSAFLIISNKSTKFKFSITI